MKYLLQNISEYVTMSLAIDTSPDRERNQKSYLPSSWGHISFSLSGISDFNCWVFLSAFLFPVQSSLDNKNLCRAVRCEEDKRRVYPHAPKGDIQDWRVELTLVNAQISFSDHGLRWGSDDGNIGKKSVLVNLLSHLKRFWLSLEQPVCM